MRLFENRRDAGRQLAARLEEKTLRDPVIVALPRGGVPVAFEVARTLAAPLEVLLVRKLGAPFQPELALGAMADGDPPEVELDEELMRSCGADRRYMEEEIARQDQVLRQRRREYSAFIGVSSLQGRTAVLIDDGAATGASVRAALRALRRRRPEAVVVALPIASREAAADLSGRADLFVCLETPFPFRSVGEFYEDFAQVDDASALALLRNPDRRSAVV